MDPEGQFGFTVVHLVQRNLKTASQSQLSRRKRAFLKPMRVQIVVAELLWELVSLSRKLFKSVSLAMAVPCEHLMALEGCCDTCPSQVEPREAGNSPAGSLF